MFLMTDEHYRPRVVDTQIHRLLGSVGAVVIEGAKACGKTTTALQAAASNVRLDHDSRLRAVGQDEPFSLLPGVVPRLIDEWQLVPDVWNAVRAEVDKRRTPGQFILTGSATPADDATRHSGAMRFIRLTMRPMSLYENGVSDGTTSLKALWDTNIVPTRLDPRCSLADIAEQTSRGGWPINLGLNTEAARELNRSYLRTIASLDIVTVDGVRRDPRKVEALLNALGRNSGTYVSNRVLQTDSASFGQKIDPVTIATYLDALVRLWVLAEQPAWGGHLRSSAPARKAAKRHLVDPSLAAATMGAGPDDLLTDREAFGQIFETLVFRDLSVYAQAADLDVRSFQDSRNREIDIVLVQGMQWAGIEVKLGSSPTVVEAAATNLRAIAASMTSQPRFLAVVTATGPSHTRPDGIHVIPIDAIGP